MAFTKAVRFRHKARLGIDGPAGAGKTYTALQLAAGLCEEGKRIAFIDTEHGSASLYAHKFDFDVDQIGPPFHPQEYIKRIKEAQATGIHDVVVLDSLTHAWSAEGGILDIVDNETERTGNSWGSGWRKATPWHNQLVEAMLQSKLHVIATIRSTMEYVQEKDAHGKTVIRKIGLAPVQRKGMEYEFDMLADMDYSHTLTVSKTRFDEIDNRIIRMPGPEFGKELRNLMLVGVAVPEITTSVTTNDDNDTF